MAPVVSRAVEHSLRHPLADELSDGAIAKHVGVSASAVCQWRAKLTPQKTKSNPKPRRRKGLDAWIE